MTDVDILVREAPIVRRKDEGSGRTDNPPEPSTTTRHASGGTLGRSDGGNIPQSASAVDADRSVPMIYVVSQYQARPQTSGGGIVGKSHTIGAGATLGAAKAIVDLVATGGGEHPVVDEPYDRDWIPNGRNTWHAFHRGWHYEIAAVPSFTDPLHVMRSRNGPGFG